MAAVCPKCHHNNTDDSFYCGKCTTPFRPSEVIPLYTEAFKATKEELTTGSTLAGRYPIIKEV